MNFITGQKRAISTLLIIFFDHFLSKNTKFLLVLAALNIYHFLGNNSEQQNNSDTFGFWIVVWTERDSLKNRKSAVTVMKMMTNRM